MFDLSLTELAVIAVVAVVFIGPKELPAVVKSVAKAMKGLRSVASEIGDAFNDMAKESGIKEAADEIDKEVRMIKGDDGKLYESYDAPSAGDEDKPS